MKRRKSSLGMGSTSKECVLETHWLPLKVENGLVELMLVTENLERLMGIKEKVSVDALNAEYSIQDNSRDTYLKLKDTIK